MKNIGGLFQTALWQAVGPDMARHALTQMKRTAYDRVHVALRCSFDIQRHVATDVRGALWDKHHYPGQNFMTPYRRS